MDSFKSILKISDVSLIRGAADVLNDFNWEVKQHEHWIVLGPNGSGKSTLMSLLQGMLWPREGQIEVLGQQFGQADITGIRKHIGWVGNDLEARLNPKESAWDIIQSGCVGTLGLKFDEPDKSQLKAVKKLIREMGLQPMLEKPFYALSQGQKRLVSIARAMLTQPQMLLLDEACAGLDPLAREKFLRKLEVIARQPKAPSIVFTTHHVEEIRFPFTHVLILKEGKVFAKGPIEKLLKSKIISELFGEPLELKKISGRYQLNLI